MEARARKTPTVIIDEAAEAIRTSYLAGVPVRVISEHYKVPRGAIYKRAWRGGWTKLKQAQKRGVPELLEPPRLPEVAPPPPIEPERMAASALEGAAELTAQGRHAEAGAYLKLAGVAARVGRLAAEEGGEYSAGALDEQEWHAVMRMRARRAAAEGRRHPCQVDPDDPGPQTLARRFWELERLREEAAAARRAGRT